MNLVAGDDDVPNLPDHFDETNVEVPIRNPREQVMEEIKVNINGEPVQRPQQAAPVNRRNIIMVISASEESENSMQSLSSDSEEEEGYHYRKDMKKNMSERQRIRQQGGRTKNIQQVKHKIFIHQ